MPKSTKTNIFSGSLKKYLGRIVNFLKDYKHIFVIFALTRIIYTIIGIYSVPREDAFRIHPIEEKRYTTIKYLNFWAKWDTAYYLEIAKQGYDKTTHPNGKANYAFFPLYPITINLFKGLFFGKEFIAAFFVSNLCYLIACVYLYKLASLDTDKFVAQRITKYTFLIPAAFLFSAPLSESLFLMLIVLSFYYARKDQWLNSSILGLLGSLTRPIGVVLFLPLVTELLDSKLEIVKKIKSFLYLCIVPMGIFIFGFYVRSLTGDFFAFMKVQYAWDRAMINPFFLLAMLYVVNTPYTIFVLYYSLSISTMFAIYFKKLRPSYWILAILMFFIPLSTGPQSIVRLSLPIFPLYFILADMTKDPEVDNVLTVTLAILQGALFVAWIAGSTIVV